MTTNRRVRPLPRIVAAAVCAVVVSAAPVRALWEVAEGEFFLSLDAAVSADSNIASNALELSDTTYTVTPGFSWERSRGRASVSLGAQCAIERAGEYAAYDSENYNANFSLDVPATASGRLKGGLSAGYFDGSRVDSYQNTRISERSFDFSLHSSYQVSNKINARLSGDYGKSIPEALAEYTSTSLSLGVGYNFRPAISLYADARFTESSSGFSELVGGGSDTSGNAILVGLDGQITQKLSGHIGFGYDSSETEYNGVVSEYSGPTYDIGLTWTPRQRTSVGLTASNGVQSTSTGGTEYVNFDLTVAQEIGLNMSGNVGINYRTSDFALSARGSDDVWQGSAGLNYSFTRQISMGLSYTYTNSESTTALINYTRSVWSLTGRARF